MEFYFFTEMPYPDLPEDYYERYGSIRVTLPNRLLDPEKTRELYNRYLDMHEFADEMGLNVMLNEHHQTATCIDSAIGLAAGSVIQRTRNGRVLLLGYPLPHRENPVQVAEEVGMLDCISGGRIDCGFVRGVGLEIHPANTNPFHNRERFYEAFQLIRKSWTIGEAFSWEGKHYNFRFVNPFPQPYQKPHPPFWTTGGSDPANIAWAADNGVTYATLLAGFEGAAKVYEAYRGHCRETGLVEPSPSKFANLFLLYVGEDDADGQKGAQELMWYLQTMDGPWFRMPPGWTTVGARKQLHQPRKDARRHRDMSFEELAESGLVIGGSADTVARRLEEFHAMSGCGNILMMMHAGPMTQDRTLASIRRFAEEVMPRLAHLGRDAEGAAAAEFSAGE